MFLLARREGEPIPARVGWGLDSREHGWEDRHDRPLIFISDREKIHEAVCLSFGRLTRKDLGKNSVQDSGKSSAPEMMTRFRFREVEGKRRTFSTVLTIGGGKLFGPVVGHPCNLLTCFRETIYRR